MAKIMLAVREASFFNLAPDEQEELSKYCDKLEPLGDGLLAIVIDSRDIEQLDIDWNTLASGTVRKIVADIKEGRYEKNNPTRTH